MNFSRSLPTTRSPEDARKLQTENEYRIAAAKQMLVRQTKPDLKAAWDALNGPDPDVDEIFARYGLNTSNLMPNRSKAIKQEIVEGSPPKLQRLQDIVPETLEFMLFPYIAVKTATALSGKGASGKGTFCNYLVALATTGRLDEISPTDIKHPMNVLMFSREDNPGAKIRPEVELAGGDISRVLFCKERHDGKQFTFAHPDVFHAAFAEAFKDGKPGFAVIDNGGDFGDRNADGNSYKQTTQELALLPELAEKYNVSVLLIIHENRSGSFMGSAAYENKMRSHISYKRVEGEQNVAMMAHEKKNLYSGASLLFGADQHEYPGLKYPVWKIHKIGEAKPEEQEKSKQQTCNEWLRDRLTDAPVANFNIMEEAEAMGYVKYHVSRARDAIGAGIITVNGVKCTALPADVAAHMMERRLK